MQPRSKGFWDTVSLERVSSMIYVLPILSEGFVEIRVGDTLLCRRIKHHHQQRLQLVKMLQTQWCQILVRHV